MRLAVALFATLAVSASAETSNTLDIYVVRGDAAQLSHFHANVGKDWHGGKFLGSLSSKTEYRYWAYPSRTAPEARNFIFGTLNYGLRLGFEAYQEATYFPAERTLLNGIVSRCRTQPDPFFIEPDRTLLVKSQGLKKEVTDCITFELNNAKIADRMAMKFVVANPQSEPADAGP